MKDGTLNGILTEAIQFEQKLSEIIFFVMVKATPVGCFVPWSGYIYFLYLIKDLGSDAFAVPFPMW